MAFQLSDDIMDITSTQMELGKEPGQDLREGVYTLAVLDALAEDEHREELARILGHGAPDGEMLDRALEIVRAGGSVDRARRRSRPRSSVRPGSRAASPRAPRSTR